MADAGTGQAKVVQEIPPTDSQEYRRQHRYDEMHWLRTEGRAYAGKWCVVEGAQLFATGESPKALYDQARAAGIEIPFIVRVPIPTDEPFGGW